MRRIPMITALLLIALLLLSSCSKAPQKDLGELMQSINEEFFLNDMETVKTTEELASRFLIGEGDVSDFCVQYASDSDERQEIILVHAKDEDAAFRVKTVLYNRLDSYLSNSKSYSPEEYAVLEKCAVNVYNNTYVTLTVAERAEEIDKYIEEYLR